MALGLLKSVTEPGHHEGRTGGATQQHSNPEVELMAADDIATVMGAVKQYASSSSIVKNALGILRNLAGAERSLPWVVLPRAKSRA